MYRYLTSLRVLHSYSPNHAQHLANREAQIDAHSRLSRCTWKRPLLVAFPSFVNLRKSIVAKEPFLEHRICPAVGVPFEGFKFGQLAISLSLSLSIRHMKDAPQSCAAFDYTCSSILPELLVDSDDVWDLRPSLYAFEKSTEDSAIFDCLSCTLSTVSPVLAITVNKTV